MAMLSAADLQGIAQKSCSVLNEMGPRIQWIQSFVTADGIYCTYVVPNEEMIREQARRLLRRPR
jgi:Nickel responsive protein SCO4226-like